MIGGVYPGEALFGGGDFTTTTGGGGGLAIDASTPAAVAGTTAQPITASFTPPANSLLLCFATGATNGTQATGLTGGGLTYTKVAAASVSNGTTSSVSTWLADVGSSPSAMTVATTGFTTGAGSANGLAVLVLTGAAANASQAGSASTSTTSVFTTGVTLGSAAATSWIFGAVADFFTNVTPTFPAGQSATFPGATSQVWHNATTGDCGWAQANTTVGNSNLTMKVSTPTGTNTGSAMVAIEIQASGAGTTPANITPIAVAVGAASATVTTPGGTTPVAIVPVARAVASASAFVTGGIPTFIPVKPYHVSVTTSSRYSVVVTKPVRNVTAVRTNPALKITSSQS